jgi:Ca2+-transporting ATPase
MDTFAALALATDPPTRSLLDRKPDPKSAPLITLRMWKMIIGQAIYQLVVTFILYFAGESILSYHSDREKAQLPALVFNVFVWMQIFNALNNRRLDNRFNVFEGITHNWFFIVILLIMIGGQTMIIFVGGVAFKVTRLNGAQWGYSIVLGFLSLPVGMIVRLIPDELVRRCIPEFFKRKRTPEVVVSDEDYQWNQGLLEIRDELAFIKRVRGGRLSNLKFKMQHPKEAFTKSRSSQSLPGTPNNGPQNDHDGSPAPPTPNSRRRGRSRSNSAFGPATVMAGIVAGSIAGWSPIDRNGGDNDSIRFSRNSRKEDLEAQDGIEVHPDTKSTDPILAPDPSEYRGPPSQNMETTPEFTVGPFAGHGNGEQSSKTDDQKTTGA